MASTEPVFRAQRDLARLGFQPGPLDGLIGSRTRSAIRAFEHQRGFAVVGEVTGVLLAQLSRVVGGHLQQIPTLPLAQVQAVASAFPEAWRAPLNACLVECGLHSRLRIAHLVGQLAHESAGFRTLTEYADGSAYEGRTDLGNTQPGDGPRFKGRGVIQLTGRANYRQYGERLGLPLESNPQLAAEPDTAFRVAGLYWLNQNLNADADADDIEAITRAINGGTNGLDSRKTLVNRAKQAFSTIS